MALRIHQVLTPVFLEALFPKMRDLVLSGGIQHVKSTFELEINICQIVGKTAERILGGENKSVCAWVECDDLKVREADPFAPPSPGHFIYYNPKRRAHWHDEAKQDLDNRTYNFLTTFGRLIIAPHEEKA